MSGFDITGTSEPWVVFVPRGHAEIDRQLGCLEDRGGRIYRIEARELMTPQSIYQSFARHLQFPGYFGQNWDAMVDCLDDLCGAVTGQIGIAGVIGEADLLLQLDHFPLFVSVLCQGADRANSSVDLDGFPLDRPAISEHFIFEFREFDREKVMRRVVQRDLVVTSGDTFVAAALNPEEWH
ncbi:hypothetical protein C3489_10170 [Streptomyces sp. Ru71]|uniref:barstar family protein n=1 Tax=Streptomyces sp. Ru71 TaxID=2080746 RepID=UPI000CDD2F5F|nr:barstar family protein [Streptomyces sp. Ru71]POX55408.1 hypothetical protein C3489_10170 [Streptomyces sp. Ru71]